MSIAKAKKIIFFVFFGGHFSEKISRFYSNEKAQLLQRQQAKFTKNQAHQNNVFLLSFTESATHGAN